MQLNEVCLNLGRGPSTVCEPRLSQFNNKKEAAEEILLYDSFYPLTHMILILMLTSICRYMYILSGFPGGSDGKESA